MFTILLPVLFSADHLPINSDCLITCSKDSVCIQAPHMQTYLLAFPVLLSIRYSTQAMRAVPPSLCNPHEIIVLQQHMDY